MCVNFNDIFIFVAFNNSLIIGIADETVWLWCIRYRKFATSQ